MNILQVVGTVPVGGVGSFLLAIHKNLDVNNFHMDCLMFESIKQSDFPNRWNSIGGKAYIVPHELKCRNILKIYSYLTLFFEKNKYDIIHVHTPAIAFLVLFFAKKNGIKIRVYHSHSSKYGNGLGKIFRNFICVMLAKKFITNALAVSSEAAKLLPVKLDEIISSGVDCQEYFFSESLHLTKKTKNKYIIMIGNMLPVKNHLFMIEVMKFVCQIRKDYVLLFVGDGALMEVIKNKINKYNLNENIKILGRRNDINKLLNISDIFVMPSISEGLPVSALEAQATGIYCLFSNTISREVQVLDDAKFLSINNCEIWAREICYFNNRRNREKEAIIFRNSNFNILNKIKCINKFYRKMNDAI